MLVVGKGETKELYNAGKVELVLPYDTPLDIVERCCYITLGVPKVKVPSR